MAVIDIETIGQVNAVTNGVAMGANEIAEDLGLPAGLRVILRLGAGYEVSKVAGKYILTNSEGKVIGEYEGRSNTIEGDKVSSFADLMSSEDAATYNKWMDLRAAGYDIPVDDYINICKESIQNPSSDTMTLGKYFPSIKQDGSSDWSIPANHSYTVMAGDTTYFSLGNDWDVIKNKYNITDEDMFELFNKPALEYTVEAGKEIRFSQDPEQYGDCTLLKEREYLKSQYRFKKLI